MFQARFWATAAASMTLPYVALAATLHVPGDFSTIQACIDAAISGVDECVVAPGTYHEKLNLLNKAITLRSSGGAEVTTIDATGLNGTVVTCSSGEGPDTVLDGFTITGGTGTLIFGTKYGGGMLNYYSNPTANNCVFSGSAAARGAGMANYYGSPIINNCRFTINTAISGGGIYNHGASPEVSNCTFGANTATSGGGMYNIYDSNAVISHCTFSGNSGGGMFNAGGNSVVSNCAFAGNSGGGMSNSSGSPIVSDCTFTGNNGESGSGGGMSNYGGNPEVIRCMFDANTARYGGGMYNVGGSPVVKRCQFVGNIAANAQGNGGGGMYNDWRSTTEVSNCAFSKNTGPLGGGMYNNNSRPTVTNCVFSGNTADFGGGMNNEYNDPTVANCTFIGNSATDDGGAINNFVSRPIVTNCAFSENSATSGGAIQGGGTVTNCVFWGDHPNEIVNGSFALTIRYSDIYGGFPVGANNDGGNIYVNPMFVRPPNPGPDGTWDGVDDDYGDLRLQAGSPCINAGDPGFVALPGETDLDGHARVLCEQVDMGAYEFGIGDVDCNQTVNLTDFAAWPGCMTGPQNPVASAPGSDPQLAIGNRQLAINCEAFDFDGDGDIDLADFSEMQRLIVAP